MATQEQHKADEDMMRLAEQQQRERDELRKQVRELEQKLDAEQALELEIERMRGDLQVMGHMQDGEDPDMKQKIKTTEKELKEKEEEWEFQESIYQALVVKHGYTNHELQDARKALINAVLRDSMEKLLPDDIHIRSNGRVRVAITQVFWRPRGLLVDQFDSKSDLINAVFASSFIPGYLAPRPATRFRNRLCVDGGLTLFMPPTAAAKTVRVCAFSASNFRLKGIEISPDCNRLNMASSRQSLCMGKRLGAVRSYSRRSQKAKREDNKSIVWLTKNKRTLTKTFRDAYAGDLRGEDTLLIGLKAIKEEYKMVEEIQTGIDQNRDRFAELVHIDKSEEGKEIISRKYLLRNLIFKKSNTL